LFIKGHPKHKNSNFQNQRCHESPDCHIPDNLHNSEPDIQHICSFPGEIRRRPFCLPATYPCFFVYTIQQKEVKRWNWGHSK
jgi:hypothetical protein